MEMNAGFLILKTQQTFSSVEDGVDEDILTKKIGKIKVKEVWGEVAHEKGLSKGNRGKFFELVFQIIS
jgi:hypothetical protein